MQVNQTSHFDAVYALLPPALKSGVDDILSSAIRESVARHTLDQLLRFSLGSESTESDPDSREAWNIQSQKAESVLSSLHPGSTDKGKKRARDEDSVQPEGTKPKRAKAETNPSENSDNDSPIFTLHTLSVSSPVRKKLHITIYHDTIRFTNATSGAQEASILLNSLTRAFLISTPGKSKPHWTVVILSDVEQNQIIFGLDAIPPSLSITTHPAPPHNYPKGTESKPALTQFLSYLPSRVIFQEPSTDQFRSSTGEPCLDAYLRAKDGHLTFFKDGLLFGEKKPCIWIGMGEIEGVRLQSATGRTFSMFIRRRVDTAEDDDDDEAEGEETEFSLIEGKNQDAVAKWVNENRHRFGVEPKSTAQAGEEQDELADDEDTPEKKAENEEDDSEDLDFKDDSDSDDGSETSESSSDEEGEDDQAESEEGEQTDDDAPGSEDEVLSSSNHPLLRPGAMPKMSRAAIDAVVGIVEQDMMGQGRVAIGGDEDEDQIDELDD